MSRSEAIVLLTMSTPCSASLRRTSATVQPCSTATVQWSSVRGSTVTLTYLFLFFLALAQDISASSSYFPRSWQLRFQKNKLLLWAHPLISALAVDFVHPHKTALGPWRRWWRARAELRCGICSSTFATPRNLLRHFKTRCHRVRAFNAKQRQTEVGNSLLTNNY